MKMSWLLSQPHCKLFRGCIHCRSQVFSPNSQFEYFLIFDMVFLAEVFAEVGTKYTKPILPETETKMFKGFDLHCEKLRNPRHVSLSLPSLASYIKYKTFSQDKFYISLLPPPSPPPPPPQKKKKKKKKKKKSHVPQLIHCVFLLFRKFETRQRVRSTNWGLKC